MKVINTWDGELEGWFEWNSMAGRIYEKCINGIKFKVVDTKDGSPSLDVEADDVATRPTIEECQRLAHATARLWAGETQ